MTPNSPSRNSSHGSQSPTSRSGLNSPLSRLQQSQVAHGSSAGPAPGSVAIAVVDPAGAQLDPALSFYGRHTTQRKLLNATMATWSLLGAAEGWAAKEGIVFVGLAVTEHGLKLIGHDVSQFTPLNRALVRAAEYNFSIMTTMGILGLLNRYASFASNAFTTLVNHGIGYTAVEGNINPASRIVQDNCIVIGNGVQQTFRACYLIALGEFGGSVISTWFKGEDTELAAAPDAFIATVLIGIASQLYVEVRDSGLKYKDLVAVNPSLWESIKEKVLKKAGGELNRIPAAFQHELMGDWIFGVAIVFFEGLGQFAFNITKDYETHIAVTMLTAGILYGYASAVRGGNRNLARRTDELTEEQLKANIKSTKPYDPVTNPHGGYLRADRVRELLKHFSDKADNIRRSPSYSRVAMSLIFPVVNAIMTQAMMTDAVMQHDGGLERMFTGYSADSSHASEIAFRCSPGLLVGIINIAMLHFLIPEKFPVLVEPKPGETVPKEKNAVASPARAFSDAMETGVWVGAVGAMADAGFYGMLMTGFMTGMSYFLSSKVLTKKVPTITPDKMPPTPDQFDEPIDPPQPRGCRFFAGYANWQRLKEQYASFRRGVSGKRDGSDDGPEIVIHARPVPGQVNPGISQQANTYLDVLAGVTPGRPEVAMDGLRMLIWDDADQIQNLGAYIDMYATSDPAKDTNQVASSLAAIVHNIRSEWPQRDQLQQEILDHAERNARNVKVLDATLSDGQRSIITRAGLDDIIIPAPPGTPRPSNAIASPGSNVRNEIGTQLEVLMQDNPGPAAIRAAVGQLETLLAGEPNALEQLRTNIGLFVSARNGVSDAPNLAAFARLRLNVEAAWQVAADVPQFASDIWEIAQDSLERSPAVNEADLTPAQADAIRETQHGDKIIRAPQPAGAAIQFAAPISIADAFAPLNFSVPSDNQSPSTYGRVGETVQAYAGPGSMHVYLHRTNRMVVFELSPDRSSVSAIRGVPAIFPEDVSRMQAAGLLTDEFAQQIRGTSQAPQSQAAPPAGIAAGTTEHGFRSAAGGRRDFIQSSPQFFRICFLRAASASSSRGPEFDTWDIHTSHLDILREALASQDSRFRDLSQAELAEQASNLFTPGGLIKLLQVGCVPMRRDVMGA